MLTGCESLFSFGNSSKSKTKEDPYIDGFIVNTSETFYDISTYEENGELVPVKLESYTNDNAILNFHYSLDYKDKKKGDVVIFELEYADDYLSMVEADTSNIYTGQSSLFNIIKIKFTLTESSGNKSGNIYFNANVKSPCKVFNIKFQNKYIGTAYCYFGRYHQTAVTDTKLIEELDSLQNKNSRGYYDYEENEYYRVEYNIKDGNTTKNYHIWFIVEPILWEIIQNYDNTLTLYSYNILDEHIYDSSGGKDIINYFCQSELFSWLNSGFYNQAFNETEKALMNKWHWYICNSMYSNYVWINYIDVGEAFSTDNIDDTCGFSDYIYNKRQYYLEYFVYYVYKSEKTFFEDGKTYYSIRAYDANGKYSGAFLYSNYSCGVRPKIQIKTS